MKKSLLVLSFLAFSSLNAEVIKVGATPVPHADILEQIKPILKNQGYELDVIEYTDYVLPNKVTDTNEIDANFFQHQPYLTEFNKNNGTDLISVGKIHLEPMGVYSKSLKDINKIEKKSRVCVPNDPTNESRALDILQKAGIVSFENVELKTAIDIKDNPKKLEIDELDAATLPRALDDCDIAVINSNYALSAGLNPLKDAIYLEDKDSPYANIVATKPQNENSPKIKALINALQSEQVKEFINTNYKGAIIPAF